MSPYNILSDIKSGRIQVKSMDSATILFFKCQRWDILNCKRFLKKMSKCGGENQLVIQFDKGGIKGYNHYINIIELEI